jgi:hypothetical protein
MTRLAKLFSFLGLLLTIVPALLVFAGKLSLERHYLLMLIGFFVWFLSAPFWMLKKKVIK